MPQIRSSLRAPATAYGWVRLLPLLAAVGSVGLLHVPQVEPSGWDWLVAVASAALVPVGGRRPVQVLVAQCLLLVAAVVTSAKIGGGVAQILACVALGEVALRCPGRRMWWSAAALCAASAADFLHFYSIAANALMVAMKTGLPLLLGSFLRSQRELAAQAEQRAREADERRSWETKVARADERAAVARELHDVVAHHVASIVLRTGVVRHVVPSADPRIDEALDDVHSIGGQALTDLRRLVAVLRDPGTAGEPPLLTSAGLSAELESVLERTRQAGAEVSTDVDEETAGRLDTAHRHAVLRVVQEGLTNVLRHAGAGARVRVMLAREGRYGVRVEVSDDGGQSGAGASARGSGHGAGGHDHRGHDHRGHGHGLTVMRERLELLGGELRVGPNSPGGAGWTLSAVLPDALLPDGMRPDEVPPEGTGPKGTGPEGTGSDRTGPGGTGRDGTGPGTSALPSPRAAAP
ncbi:sensor histidine kinase [Streptomyces marispadix]|uniref:histidine kinase n=1 Tax=Streptomyces marispadix TaxID=2922868 RepID=A0ABS9SX77_9ACTN|nr:histidine kinase [Streptomyces marispadix]MCH6160884.1 histidine kinase [Streptomyces marispadix]